MRELGYRPNSAARALKRGEFRTIGVILFTLATTGNSRTVEAIATQAAQEGYAITLIPVAVPTQDERARRLHPARRAGRRRRHRDHGGPPARRRQP